MIGFIILYAYLGGLGIALTGSAAYVGLNSYQIKERYAIREKNAYPASNKYLTADKVNLSAACALEGWLLFFTSLLWPIGLFLMIAFLLGIRKAIKRRSIQAQLDEANAEIERIRRDEGWLSK